MTTGRGIVAGYRALAFYLVAAFVGGGLLAPWLYFGARAFAEHVPTLATLGRYPFHRYVDRSVLLAAFVGLWPFLRSLGVTSPRDLRLFSLDAPLHRIFVGLGLGGATLAVATVVTLGTGVRVIDTGVTWATVAHVLLNGAVSAAAVALLEETLFRGVLFGGLRRALSWKHALLLSSALYAAMHFLQPPSDPDVVRWYSGVEQLPAAFAALSHLQRLLPTFLNLTLVGGALALAYHRTGDLWCSVGLHAGWIFFGRCYELFTRAAIPGVASRGNDLLVGGWLAMLLLSATLGGLLWVLPRVTRQPEEG